MPVIININIKNFKIYSILPLVYLNPYTIFIFPRIISKKELEYII